MAEEGKCDCGANTCPNCGGCEACGTCTCGSEEPKEEQSEE